MTSTQLDGDIDGSWSCKIPQRSVRVSSMRMIRSATPIMAWNPGFISHNECLCGFCVQNDLKLLSIKRVKIPGREQRNTKSFEAVNVQLGFAWICHIVHIWFAMTLALCFLILLDEGFVSKVCHLLTLSISLHSFGQIGHSKQHHLRLVEFNDTQNTPKRWHDKSIKHLHDASRNCKSWRLGQLTARLRQRAMQKLRQSPHLEGNLKLRKSRCSFLGDVFICCSFVHYFSYLFLYWFF